MELVDVITTWNYFGKDGFGQKLKLADVNANSMDDVNPLFHVMADVIAISWYCDSHYYLVGRCCCLIIGIGRCCCLVADVIAIYLLNIG